jgi:hypothetical protein
MEAQRLFEDEQGDFFEGVDERISSIGFGSLL